MQNSEFRIQNAKYGVQSAKCRAKRGSPGRRGYLSNTIRRVCQNEPA